MGGDDDGDGGDDDGKTAEAKKEEARRLYNLFHLPVVSKILFRLSWLNS